jgi:hypothetical protein
LVILALIERSSDVIQMNSDASGQWKAEWIHTFGSARWTIFQHTVSRILVINQYGLLNNGAGCIHTGQRVIPDAVFTFSTPR